MANVIKRMLGQFNDDNRIKIIQSVCDVYNRTLFKYTNSFVGRISRPKDSSDIPKQYMSVNEYISSNAQWQRILDFHKRIIDEQVDIVDYFDTMIKNWTNISYAYNIKGHVRPVFATIISKYGILTYWKYKKMEEKNLLINRGRIEENKIVSPIMPTLQSDINNLFRLRLMNEEMSYYDIVNVFTGEFSKKFIDIIKNMKEEDITRENLENICNISNSNKESNKTNKNNKESNRISGHRANMKESNLSAI